jgi:transcriptional regulator with XRE-family HTH domain
MTAKQAQAQRGGSTGSSKAASIVLVRRLLGEVLRRRRTTQQLTLREVAARARVSLGYLSEVERGRKEASSELLASICEALGVPLSVVMREVSDELARAESAALDALEPQHRRSADDDAASLDHYGPVAV